MDSLFNALYKVNHRGETVRRKNWERRLKRYDKITGISEQEAGLDSFDFSFDSSSRGVEVNFDVTDSITDFTYVGGDALSLTFTGTWQVERKGRIKNKRRTLTFGIDNEGPIDGTESYSLSSRGLNTLFSQADNVQFYLNDSMDNPVFSGAVSSADLFF